MSTTALTGRERALLSRDYSLKDVLLFSRMPRQEIEKTALHLFADLTADATPSRAPSCIFIGAQPGCGKSTYIRKIKASNTGFRYIDLTMDDYRSFHPLYAELEDLIASHWQGRVENDHDSPGSDIADFTQLFAGDVVDRLEEMVSGEFGGPMYSILYEWAMRASFEPLNAMRRLHKRGYRIEVCFIAVNRRISLAACRQRSAIMNSKGRLFRTIPDSFHQLSVERLPAAINEIYRAGYEQERLIDTFVLIDREGNVLWRNGDTRLPGDVFADLLENGPLDVENSEAYAEVAYERESRGLSIPDPSEPTETP
jgi:hypothetical protein